MPNAKKNASKQSKQTKSKKTSKSKKMSTTPVQEVVAPEPVSVQEVVAPESVSVQEDVAPESVAVQEDVASTQPTELETLFSNYNAQLSELRALEASLISNFKKLQKATMRHLKELSKKNKKRKLTESQKKARAPSGFAKPTVISPELCKFLGMKSGTEMARTEVTKHLTTYIKNNSLQDQENKRKIIPDEKLRKLLGVTKNDEVTYFNLQKYMKVHFPLSKANLALAAASSASQ